MKRTLSFKELSEHDVPDFLDRKVLEYAGRQSRIRKIRASFFRWGAAAAVVILAAGSTVFFALEQPKPERELARMELLALADFSRLDQAGYNMTLEVDCCRELAQHYK